MNFSTTVLKQKWFTLTELLVVISVLAIIALGVTRIDFNKRLDKENAARLSSKIVSLYNEQHLQSISWKQATFLNIKSLPSYQALRINKNTVETIAYSGALSIVGESNKTPFFTDKFFTIKSISLGAKGGAVVTPTDLTLDILFDPSTKNLSFSGVDTGGTTYKNEYVTASIVTQYKAVSQTIFIDRRSGRIFVK